MVGEASGMGPPPGAESKASWSMSKPVVWPAVDSQGVVSGAEGQPAGVGSAQRDGQRLAVEGGGWSSR